MNLIFQAGYRDNTLGLPKLCPKENLTNINRSILFTYLSHHFNPKRIVVAGVGVEHKRLVEAANKYFVEEKPIWELEKNLVVTGKHMSVDESIAQYTGGIVQVNYVYFLHYTLIQNY